MKPTTKLSRRQFMGLAAGTTALVAVDSLLVEPSLVKTRFVHLNRENTTHRVVQFTDVHHKGDRAYLVSAVEQINALSPDLVCFTGDLVEQSDHLPEALSILSGIKAPLYGVPGNHDYTSNVDFNVIKQAFAATGGRWLLDENVSIDGGALNIFGTVCDEPNAVMPLAGAKNILLMHYPAFINQIDDKKFDLVLAGHSHGGQVRLPFVGAIILPKGVDGYDMGLYQTASGPLYVNPGLGCMHLDIRFNCRPEISVFEV